jgi:hypothetical protein
VAGRTREASSGWPSNGKALLGGWLAHDGARPSAANIARPNGYALETGDAACDGWGLPKGGIEAWRMLGSMRGYRVKMRKRNNRRGGSRRVGGGRPEAGLRVLGGGERQFSPDA